MVFGSDPKSLCLEVTQKLCLEVTLEPLNRIGKIVVYETTPSVGGFSRVFYQMLWLDEYSLETPFFFQSVDKESSCDVPAFLSSVLEFISDLFDTF